MKEKNGDFLRLFALWAWGFLGGGIIFPLRKVFGRIKMAGYEKRKSIFPQEGVIVIYSYPFSFLCKPIIFPSSFLTIIKRGYDGKFWFFPVIERNEEKGEKSIRRFIQKVKESKIIIITSDSVENSEKEEVPKTMKFQSGICILSKKRQVSTLPIWTENKNVISDKSLLDDYFFFFSVFSIQKGNGAP